MAEHKITIDGEKCIGCGLCVKDCVARNIDIRDHKARVLSDDCIFCGHCAAVCPKEAVTISGYAEKPVAKEKEPRLDPEEVRNTIRFRRTVRQFQERAIPREVIGQILEAGGMTHTAKNLRDLSFFVLDREKDRLEKAAAGLFRKLKPLADCISPLARRTEIDDHFFFFNAPTVIVVAAKDAINGTLAAQNMEFMAEAYGLGVLYSGYFTIAANHSREIKKALGMPRGKKAVATLVLGYPAVKYQRSVPREKTDTKYL